MMPPRGICHICGGKCVRWTCKECYNQGKHNGLYRSRYSREYYHKHKKT